MFKFWKSNLAGNTIQGNRKIALFHTGRKHAGENMSDVLRKRDADRGPPIQMCDALSRNVSKQFAVILANCLVHARRNFVDVAEVFPEECRFVLEILKQVYKNDEEAKRQQMSDEQRLELHQSKSGPLMEELKEWLEEQIQGNKVEPNSSMGQAFSYMLNHWKALTLFLRVPGAPLDNNICERALKKVIQHRKNSLFYKTLHGAYIGDLFMSIIYTCNLEDVNAFEYLNALEEHSAELFKHPELWLPWNYHEQLARQDDQPD
ncbi:MAG: transposase [Planctomycetes bacterium]|nr:transposase [Planctomycetota bacterium]